MNKFLNKLNDYSCIVENDLSGIVTLSHYTKSDKAVKGIVNDNIFRATHISYLLDKNEGVLILNRVRELLPKLELFTEH